MVLFLIITSCGTTTTEKEVVQEEGEDKVIITETETSETRKTEEATSVSSEKPLLNSYTFQACEVVAGLTLVLSVIL